MNCGEMFLIRSMVFSQAPKSAITRSVTGQRHFSYDWIDCRFWSSPARTAAHFPLHCVGVAAMDFFAFVIFRP